MAACTLATYTQADLETTLPLTFANLLASFVVKRPGGPGRAARATPTAAWSTSSRRASTTCASAARSACAASTRCARTSPRESQRLYIESFIVPVGEDATTCGVLQFVTPNLRMARGFSALFVAIAETVVLLTPDQETEIAAIRP